MHMRIATFFQRWALAFVTGVLLVGLLAASPARASEDKPFLGEDTRLVRLANGLTVLIKEDHRFPIVSTRLYVHAGAAYEKPAWAGISHLLEHMVFKGTARRPKGEISRVVESAGGYLNAATSFDYTVYITDVPSRHWKLGMDVVEDMAFHAALDPEELKSEKEVVIAELKRGQDEPLSRLFQTVQADVLAGTPYAHPIIGFEKTIRAITAEDIRAYVQELYQPRNMLLVVVGDVSASKALAEAERLFGGYRNNGADRLAVPIDAATLGNGGLVSVTPGPWNKVYLVAAVPVPGIADYQSMTIEVLAQLLGGDATAFLPRKYKYERQLVDSVSVQNLSLERVGMLMIFAELDRSKLARFWQELTSDLTHLSTGMFTAQELERAKLNLEENLYRSRETVSGMASHLGYFQFFLGGEQGEINIIQALRSVDKAALQRVIDGWIVPSRMTAAVLEPRTEQGGQASDTAAVMRAALGSGDGAGKGSVQTQKTALIGRTEVIELDSRRKVILIPDKSMPHMALELRFAGGESLQEPDQQGLASLVARTLTEGTGKRSRLALQGAIADRAGVIEASTGKTSFGVSLDGPSRFSRDLLGLFTEIVNTPAFTPEDVAREKQAQIAAISSAEDRPIGLLFRNLPPFLFPDSVFGYQALGDPGIVNSFSQEQIRIFWEKQKKRPWVLAVTGSFDREEILAFARALPVPSEAGSEIEPPAWGKEKALALKLPERNQAHLMLVFPTAPLSSPDTPGLALMEETFGGMGGPFFSRLRDEKGLGYTVSVFNVQNDELGYMVFYIGTEPERLAEAEKGFRDILAELRKTPLPATELTRGCNQLEGNYYRAMQRLASRSGEAATLALEGRALDFNRKKIELARQVTPAQLQGLVKKYLDDSHGYVVTVLP